MYWCGRAPVLSRLLLFLLLTVSGQCEAVCCIDMINCQLAENNKSIQA